LKRKVPGRDVTLSRALDLTFYDKSQARLLRSRFLTSKQTEEALLLGFAAGITRIAARSGLADRSWFAARSGLAAVVLAMTVKQAAQEALLLGFAAGITRIAAVNRGTALGCRCRCRCTALGCRCAALGCGCATVGGTAIVLATVAMFQKT
jgi:hypothetical protein